MNCGRTAMARTLDHVGPELKKVPPMNPTQDVIRVINVTLRREVHLSRWKEQILIQYRDRGNRSRSRHRRTEEAGGPRNRGPDRRNGKVHTPDPDAGLANDVREPCPCQR